jgi:hypothetical protein
MFRGLFTPLENADDCSQIGLKHWTPFGEQLLDVRQRIYTPIVDTVNGNGQCSLLTAHGPGTLVDVINTSPVNLKIAQEIALMPPARQQNRVHRR